MYKLTRKDEQGNWCLKGVPWENLNAGKIITKEVSEKLYGALWKLMEYEDTDLSPEDVDGRNLARWIPVKERFPTENEYRVTCSAHSSKPFLRRLEIAYITDTTEYQFGYYDGYKWIDKCNKNIPNVVAWKTHEPFNPQN